MKNANFIIRCFYTNVDVLFFTYIHCYFIRSKRLAPVLIKEVTRRVNVTDIWQAVYTAGRYLVVIFRFSLGWFVMCDFYFLVALQVLFSLFQPLRSDNGIHLNITSLTVSFK